MTVSRHVHRGCALQVWLSLALMMAMNSFPNSSSSNSSLFANGIELNPFKNTNSNTNTNVNNANNNNANANNNNNNNNAKTTKTTTMTQSELMQMATGTITTLEPGTEKEPVSCNEIMAKAVVVASEEKEAFRHQAAAATDLAATQKKRADELAERINAAVSEARNATIEFEALRLMSDRLLQEAKDQASLQLEALRNDNQIKMDTNRVTVQLLQQDADQRIHQAEMRAKETAEAALLEIREIQEKAHSAAQLQITKVQQNADQLMINLQQESQQTVTAALSQAKLIETDARQSAHQQIQQIQSTATQTMNDILSTSSRERDAAIDRAVEIELQAELHVQNAVHSSEAAIREVHRSAQAHSDSLQQDKMEAIRDIEERMDKELELAELAFENYRTRGQEEQDRLRETMEWQTRTMAEKDAELDELASSFEAISRDHQYWKDLSGRNMDTLVQLQLREDLCFLIVLSVLLLVMMMVGIKIKMHRWIVPLGSWLVRLPFRLLFLPPRIFKFVLL